MGSALHSACPTSPLRGEVAAKRRVGVTRTAGSTRETGFQLATITPPRSFAPTLPLKGRVGCRPNRPAIEEPVTLTLSPQAGRGDIGQAETAPHLLPACGEKVAVRPDEGQHETHGGLDG